MGWTQGGRKSRSRKQLHYWESLVEPQVARSGGGVLHSVGGCLGQWAAEAA